MEKRVQAKASSSAAAEKQKMADSLKGLESANDRHAVRFDGSPLQMFDLNDYEDEEYLSSDSESEIEDEPPLPPSPPSSTDGERLITQSVNRPLPPLPARKDESATKTDASGSEVGQPGSHLASTVKSSATTAVPMSVNNAPKKRGLRLPTRFLNLPKAQKERRDSDQCIMSTKSSTVGSFGRPESMFSSGTVSLPTPPAFPARARPNQKTKYEV